MYIIYKKLISLFHVGWQANEWFLLLPLLIPLIKQHTRRHSDTMFYQCRWLVNCKTNSFRSYHTGRSQFYSISKNEKSLKQNRSYLFSCELLFQKNGRRSKNKIESIHPLLLGALLRYPWGEAQILPASVKSIRVVASDIRAHIFYYILRIY